MDSTMMTIIVMSIAFLWVVILSFALASLKGKIDMMQARIDILTEFRKNTIDKTEKLEAKQLEVCNHNRDVIEQNRAVIETDKKILEDTQQIIDINKRLTDSIEQLLEKGSSNEPKRQRKKRGASEQAAPDGDAGAGT